MAILPIVTYNNQVLREVAKPITENSDELQQLIDDMLETMENASGVGLAAPQIGKSIRLFVADADPMLEEDQQDQKRGPMVFINPEIKDKSGKITEYEEGCLSLPYLTEVVKRPERISISYLDRNFEQQEETMDSFLARVIQHEYDHIDGILFFDHLGSFRRRLLKSKLNEIDAGEIEPDYPII